MTCGWACFLLLPSVGLQQQTQPRPPRLSLRLVASQGSGRQRHQLSPPQQSHPRLPWIRQRCHRCGCLLDPHLASYRRCPHPLRRPRPPPLPRRGRRSAPRPPPPPRHPTLERTRSRQQRQPQRSTGRAGSQSANTCMHAASKWGQRSAAAAECKRRLLPACLTCRSGRSSA